MSHATIASRIVHAAHRRLETERAKPMRDWVCRKCGHEVLAKDRPQSMRWTDGHVCSFVEAKDKTKESFR